jgi:hypothetical protein
MQAEKLSQKLLKKSKTYGNQESGIPLVTWRQVKQERGKLVLHAWAQHMVSHLI